MPFTIPQQNLLVRGYELLRILALEFSLRTRSEAICLRSEELKRDVKVDSKSVHAMSDLIRGKKLQLMDMTGWLKRFLPGLICW